MLDPQNIHIKQNHRNIWVNYKAITRKLLIHKAWGGRSWETREEEGGGNSLRKDELEYTAAEIQTLQPEEEEQWEEW